MLLCSLHGKIVLDQRFKSICEVKTFLCLHSCRIKRVPALLQTAVSFHTSYSVIEKSSLLLCLSYCPGCIVYGTSLWGKIIQCIALQYIGQTAVYVRQLLNIKHFINFDFLTEIIICYFNNNKLQKCTNGKAFYIAASPQVFATLI